MKLRFEEQRGTSPVKQSNEFGSMVRRNCDYWMLFCLNLHNPGDHLPQEAALALNFSREAG
jgi:hypothetical protein